ncbi:MaoC family dehydratase [Rhodococcus fascians]|nr:MaoC family dehydratase [Rhodococcus fascians]MBY4114669.1 MaoC family dehydratase [Rhodococcus fascians]
MRVFHGLDELEPAVGSVLGTSQWFDITQQRIDGFADSTSDHQWIHVDPVRAGTGPFGATIAHGFLTLSLIPVLSGQIWRVEGASLAVNYGTDKVRFLNPVPVDSRIRAHARLDAVKPNRLGKVVSVSYTLELEKDLKTACVATSLTVFAQ